MSSSYTSYSSSSYSSSSTTGADGVFTTTHEDRRTTQNNDEAPVTEGSQSYAKGSFDSVRGEGVSMLCLLMYPRLGIL